MLEGEKRVKPNTQLDWERKGDYYLLGDYLGGKGLEWILWYTILVGVEMIGLGKRLIIICDVKNSLDYSVWGSAKTTYSSFICTHYSTPFPPFVPTIPS